MRILWSFLAIRSSAPSSMRLPLTVPRPSFHWSTTRIEYCSISSGWVVGTMSTASCEPLADSNAASFCSRAVCWPAVSVPVRSVTRALSGGTGTWPAAHSVRPSSTGSAAAAARRARGAEPLIASLFCGWLGRRRRTRHGRSAGVETHGRRRCDLLLVGNREVRLHLEVEHLGGEVHREGAHRDVVALYRLDVAVTRHGDAIFRALELRLQVAEVLIGLEVGVALHHYHQTAERLGQLALRGLVLLEQLGV